MDFALAAAINELERRPSRETAAGVLRLLADSDLELAAAKPHLDHAATRVMQALATRARITLDSTRIGTLFVQWPRAVRAGFEVALGNAPLWTGDCPRCDGALLTANDSYGMSTYFRKFRCDACDWRDEQPTNEPTMASLYSEMNRQAGERRAYKLRGHPLESDAECWPFAGHEVEDYDPDQALVAVRGIGLRSALLRRGKVDHVAVDARSFVEHGGKLVATAVRSVAVVDADDHLTAALASPAFESVRGFAFQANDRVAVMDALLTAVVRPRLRHLRIQGVALTLKDLEAFVVSPLAGSLACFHVEIANAVTVDDRDYVTFYHLNCDGHAVVALAKRHSFLSPIAEALRTRTSLT